MNTLGHQEPSSLESVRQVVYISRPKNMRDETGLMELFHQSRAFNQNKDVTGVLLCGDEFFVQCIEGDASVIDSLYRRIEFDPRHDDVTKLIDLRATDRSFQGWCMAVTWDTVHETLNGMTSTWDKQRRQRDPSLSHSAAWVLIRSMWLTYGMGGIRLPKF